MLHSVHQDLKWGNALEILINTALCITLGEDIQCLIAKFKEISVKKIVSLKQVHMTRYFENI